jgi:hypothetical protein
MSSSSNSSVPIPAYFSLDSRQTDEGYAAPILG